MSDRIKTVYFAGKVTKDGYRQKMFGPRVMSDGYKIYTRKGGGQVRYGGPFAISNDHGGAHESFPHALVDPFHEGGHCGIYSAYCADTEHWDIEDKNGKMGTNWQETVSRCLEQIRKADAVHAYLESTSCYGTLVELGYASALGKPIYIVLGRGMDLFEHLWFSFHLPHVVSRSAGGPCAISPDLVAKPKTRKERYHEYLQSEAWNILRKAKIREADGRCQLCNASQKLSVHHRTYDRVFNEPLTDLIALCSNCHEKFHGINGEI